jgi:hypothetical protein
MKPENRQKVLIIVALVAVGIFLGDSLVLTPLIQSWKERTTRIADLRKKVDGGTQLLSRDAVIRNRWESMRTNALPAEMSVAEGRVLKSFDRWSQESRISITSIKPQWKHNPDDYVTLECRVDAYGSLSTITRFLYEIEKDPVALKVDSIELAAKDNDGSQITLGLQVSGLVLNTPEQ